MTARRMLGQNQVRAGLREAECNGPADSLRRSGHDGNFVFQSKARVIGCQIASNFSNRYGFAKCRLYSTRVPDLRPSLPPPRAPSEKPRAPAVAAHQPFQWTIGSPGRGAWK